MILNYKYEFLRYLWILEKFIVILLITVPLFSEVNKFNASEVRLACELGNNSACFEFQLYQIHHSNYSGEIKYKLPAYMLKAKYPSTFSSLGRGLAIFKEDCKIYRRQKLLKRKIKKSCKRYINQVNKAFKLGYWLDKHINDKNLDETKLEKFLSKLKKADRAKESIINEIGNEIIKARDNNKAKLFSQLTLSRQIILTQKDYDFMVLYPKVMRSNPQYEGYIEVMRNQEEAQEDIRKAKEKLDKAKGLKAKKELEEHNKKILDQALLDMEQQKKSIDKNNNNIEEISAKDILDKPVKVEKNQAISSKPKDATILKSTNNDTLQHTNIIAKNNDTIEKVYKDEITNYQIKKQDKKANLSGTISLEYMISWIDESIKKSLPPTINNLIYNKWDTETISNFNTTDYKMILLYIILPIILFYIFIKILTKSCTIVRFTKDELKEMGKNKPIKNLAKPKLSFMQKFICKLYAILGFSYFSQDEVRQAFQPIFNREVESPYTNGETTRLIDILNNSTNTPLATKRILESYGINYSEDKIISIVAKGTKLIDRKENITLQDKIMDKDTVLTISPNSDLGKVKDIIQLSSDGLDSLSNNDTIKEKLEAVEAIYGNKLVNLDIVNEYNMLDTVSENISSTIEPSDMLSLEHIPYLSIALKTSFVTYNNFKKINKKEIALGEGLKNIGNQVTDTAIVGTLSLTAASAINSSFNSLDLGGVDLAQIDIGGVDFDIDADDFLTALAMIGVFVARKLILKGYKNVKNAMFGDPLETYYNLQDRATKLENDFIVKLQKEYPDILKSLGIDQYNSFSRQIDTVNKKMKEIKIKYIFGIGGAQSMQYYIMENKKEFFAKTRENFYISKEFQKIILRNIKMYNIIIKAETKSEDDFNPQVYKKSFLNICNDYNKNAYNNIRDILKKSKSNKVRLTIIGRQILSKEIETQAKIYSQIFKDNDNFIEIYQLSDNYIKIKADVFAEENRLKNAGHLK